MEHGVHWSFFFSMACVAILASLCEAGWSIGVRLWRGRAARHVHAGAGVYVALGAAIAIIHQYLLSLDMMDLPPGPEGGPIHTLTDYIFNAPRIPGDFISQNREGLISVVGFASIYFLGVGVGCLVLDPSLTSLPDWKRRFKLLVSIALASWAALYFYLTRVSSTPGVTGISRRLVNLPYIIWVVAFNLTMLLALLAQDFMVVVVQGDATSKTATRERKAAPSVSTAVSAAAHPPSHPPILLSRVISSIIRPIPPPLPRTALRSGSLLMDAVNSNFLGVFLISNICTGIVNISCHTLDEPDGTAFAWLAGYLAVVTAVAMTWRKLGVVFKVW